MKPAKPRAARLGSQQLGCYYIRTSERFMIYRPGESSKHIVTMSRPKRALVGADAYRYAHCDGTDSPNAMRCTPLMQTAHRCYERAIERGARYQRGPMVHLWNALRTF